MRLGQQTIHFYSKKAIPNILVADGSIFCHWFFRSGLLFSSSPPTLRHSLDFLRHFFVFTIPCLLFLRRFPPFLSLRLRLSGAHSTFCGIFLFLPSHVFSFCGGFLLFFSSPLTLRRSLDFLRRFFCFYHPMSLVFAAVSSFSFPSPPTLRLSLRILRRHFCLLPSHVSLLAAVSSSSSSSPPTLRRSLDFLRRFFVFTIPCL